jgi:hypothetical protein
MAGRMREGGSRDNVDRGRIEASEALFSLGPLVTNPRCHGLRQGEVGGDRGEGNPPRQTRQREGRDQSRRKRKGWRERMGKAAGDDQSLIPGSALGWQIERALALYLTWRALRESQGPLDQIT